MKTKLRKMTKDEKLVVRKQIYLFHNALDILEEIQDLCTPKQTRMVAYIAFAIEGLCVALNYLEKWHKQGRVQVTVRLKQ